MDVVSVSVRGDVRKRMKQLRFINWSQVASEAFEQKIRDIDLIEKFKAESQLTEKDALEIGAKIKKGMARRFAQAMGREAKGRSR